MSELPPGWSTATVGDLVDSSPKNDCSDTTEVGFIPMQRMGTRFLDAPGFEVRRWASVKKGYTAFADGDVLLARITPCFENGKAGIPRGLPNGLGAGSTEYFVLRPKANALNAKYLLALVKSAAFLSDGKASMTGAVGQQRVPKAQVLGYPIALAPYAEQMRVASKLDAVLGRVDACRDRLDRVPRILKRFREAVLEAAVSGRLTEEWREERSVPTPEVPERLDTLWESASYGTAAKSSKSGSVPVLRMGNIQDGAIDWSDLVYTSDQSEIDKYLLSDGDVLFNRTNSPELVGKTAVYHGDRAAIFAGYLIRVRCGPRLDPDYLGYCLNSPAGRHYCWQVKTDGVSQSNINASKLGAFECLVPEIEEQAEIVRRVEDLFRAATSLERQYQAAVARVERLTPAVLAKAFRGELVPQDPNDEPAEKLLERIRAAREAEAGKKCGSSDGARGRGRMTTKPKAQKDKRGVKR